MKRINRIIVLLLLVTSSIEMLAQQEQDEDISVQNPRIGDTTPPQPVTIGDPVDMCFTFTAPNGVTLIPDEVITFVVSFQKVNDDKLLEPKVEQQPDVFNPTAEVPEIFWQRDPDAPNTFIGTISEGMESGSAVRICFEGVEADEEATVTEANNNNGVGFKVDITPHSKDPSGTETNDVTELYTYTCDPLVEYPEGSACANLFLPVELIYFNAEAVGLDGELEWSTATEIDNSHFNVERSIDGVNFEIIGRVEGAGTTRAEQSYSYTDANAAVRGNLVYYRLNQVDYDGTKANSEVELINFSGARIQSSMYPNPAREGSDVVLQGEDIEKVELYTMQGVLVGSYEQGKQRTITIETGELASGAYMVVINGKERKSLVVEK